MCHPGRFNGRRRRAAGARGKAAQPEFQLPSNSFGAFAAAAGEFAAVQRGWRDFRIAQSSCESADPSLPKNWSLWRLSRLHEQEQWRPK
jgi:hypothetical protein